MRAREVVFTTVLFALLIPAIAVCADKFDFEVAVSGGGFIPMDRFEVEEVYVSDTVVTEKTSDSSFFEMGPYAEVSFALVPTNLYIPHSLVFRASWGNSKGLFKGNDSDGHYEKELNANFCYLRWGLDIFLSRSEMRPFFGLFWGVMRAGLELDDDEIESYGGLLSLEVGARQDIGRFFLGAAIEMAYGFELWFRDEDEKLDKSYEIDLDHFPASARINAGVAF